MPGDDDNNNASALNVQSKPLDPQNSLHSEEDHIDLDYEEDISTAVIDEDNKRTSVNTEEMKKDDDEKEDGELEDGELSSSDDEAATLPQAKKTAKSSERQPISVRSPIPESKNDISSASKKTNETAWERGLREAREAMRRASKVREEPDFEKKRLVAVPVGRRSSRTNTDSDNSNSPGPRRNRSESRDIPSLLDIRTSPPPRRIPPKEGLSDQCTYVHNKRPIQRRSPSYGVRTSSSTRSTSSLSPWRFFLDDLGPQVIYPNGRPCPKREPERENRDRNRRRDLSPRRRDRRDPQKKKENCVNKLPQREEVKKDKKKIPISTSPISSDSEHNSTLKKSTKLFKNDMSAVDDPWVRKKKEKTDHKRRKRSSSNSSSSSSSTSSSRSTFTGRRKKNISSSSSSDSDDRRNKKKARKDDRLFKKKPKISEERNPVEEFFTKKKSDIPAAFRKRRRKNSDSESDKEIKGMEAISGSESDTASSISSASRSNSPNLPSKFRSRPKSPSPISDSSRGPSPPPPPPNDPAYVSLESPPSKKNKSSKDSGDENTDRKQQLLQQLREVEDELEKRRSVRVEAAH